MTCIPTALWGVGAMAALGAALWRRRQVRPQLVLQLSALLAAALAVTLSACAHFGASAPWAAETQPQALWGCIGFSAAAVGLAAGRLGRRVPVTELLLAALPWACATWLYLLWGAGIDSTALPSTLLRGALVMPALYALCAYFGASLGYLLWGAGAFEPRLGFEALIGRKFLLSRASAVLSTVTTISIIGVGLGVWLVLVSLGVLAGFEHDLQRKIIGANAHVVVQKKDTSPFAYTPALSRALLELPEQPAANVLAHAVFLNAEVAIASDSQYTGAMVYGIDPQASAAVLTVLQQVVQGSLRPVQAEVTAAARATASAPGTAATPETAATPATSAAPETAATPKTAATAGTAATASRPPQFARPAALRQIVIGKEMARSLNVRVGDRLRLISPSLEVLSPMGPTPKSLGFVVAAIFSSDMYEYDSRYVYISLPAARKFLDLDSQAVSGLQVQCRNPEATLRAGTAVQQAATAAGVGGLQSLDWRQRNQTLFAALKLEKVVAFVVLVFIILVASFSIVNTLTLSVLEKSREIAILKTMGARDVSILKIFLIQGLWVGGVGTAMGCAAGIASMKALQQFGFWIPGDVYYIDSLPVRLNFADVGLVVCAALLIVWNFAVFPSLRGAAMTPVEGLRDS